MTNETRKALGRLIAAREASRGRRTARFIGVGCAGAVCVFLVPFLLGTIMSLNSQAAWLALVVGSLAVARLITFWVRKRLDASPPIDLVSLQIHRLLANAGIEDLIELTDVEEMAVRVPASMELRGRLKSLDAEHNPGLTDTHYRAFARILGGTDVALMLAILEAVPVIARESLLPAIDKLASGPRGTTIERSLQKAAEGAALRMRHHLANAGSDLLRASKTPGDSTNLLRATHTTEGGRPDEALRAAGR